MPCSDSSSSISIQLDLDDRLRTYDFAKITCGRTISNDSSYLNYCKGKSIDEILTLPFVNVVKDLSLVDEEEQFIFYLEWDTLRSALVQYKGTSDASIDEDRCRITSVENTEEGTEIALVILPPKEMPKILPCNLGDDRYKEYEGQIEEGGELN